MKRLATTGGAKKQLVMRIIVAMVPKLNWSDATLKASRVSAGFLALQLHSRFDVSFARGGLVGTSPA